MSMFIGRLMLVPDPDIKQWVVVDSFIYAEDQAHVYKVPSGFATDGASIPRFFWRVIGHPYEPKVVRAAVVHDYLYRDKDVEVTKEQADKVFRDILKRDGVGKIKRNLMYYAVKWFGVFAFQKKNSPKKNAKILI